MALKGAAEAEGLPLRPAAMPPRARESQHAPIVQHDAKLVRESLSSVQCDECDKWRKGCDQWYHSGRLDDTFTCSMAGLNCNMPEDEEWMYIHAWCGGQISARDLDELQLRPILENSIRHMIYKVEAQDLWRGRAGDRAQDTVNEMTNELQHPNSLELTVLGRGPERVGKIKKILEWIMRHTQIGCEQDIEDEIRQELGKVRDRLCPTRVATQHRRAERAARHL